MLPFGGTGRLSQNNTALTTSLEPDLYSAPSWVRSRLRIHWFSHESELSRSHYNKKPLESWAELSQHLNICLSHELSRLNFAKIQLESTQLCENQTWADSSQKLLNTFVLYKACKFYFTSIIFIYTIWFPNNHEFLTPANINMQSLKALQWLHTNYKCYLGLNGRW